MYAKSYQKMFFHPIMLLLILVLQLFTWEDYSVAHDFYYFFPTSFSNKQ